MRLFCTPVTGQNHSLSFTQITINLLKVVTTSYSQTDVPSLLILAQNLGRLVSNIHIT